MATALEASLARIKDVATSIINRGRTGDLTQTLPQGGLVQQSYQNVVLPRLAQQQQIISSPTWSRDVANNIVPSFTANPNPPQLGPSPFLERAAQAQQTVSNIGTGLRNVGVELANYPLSVLQKGLVNPAIDVGRITGATVLGNQPLPQYSDLVSGPGKVGYQISGKIKPSSTQGLGVKNNWQEVLGNFAQTADPVVGAAVLSGLGNAAGKVTLDMTGRALFELAKQSAIASGKVGALQGLTQGLQNVRNETDLGNYAKQVALETGKQAAVMAIVGFATPYATYGGKKVLDVLRNTEIPIGQSIKPTEYYNSGDAVRVRIPEGTVVVDVRGNPDTVSATKTIDATFVAPKKGGSYVEDALGNRYFSQGPLESWTILGKNLQEDVIQSVKPVSYNEKAGTNLADIEDDFLSARELRKKIDILLEDHIDATDPELLQQVKSDLAQRLSQSADIVSSNANSGNTPSELIWARGTASARDLGLGQQIGKKNLKDAYTILAKYGEIDSIPPEYRDLVPSSIMDKGMELYNKNQEAAQLISNSKNIPPFGQSIKAVDSSQQSLTPQQIDELTGKQFSGWQSENPVDRVIQALKGAQPIRNQQEALYSLERSKRAGAVAAMGEKVPGEQGYFAQLGQLKGELPKVDFQGIRDKISQQDIDSLFNQVEQSNLSPFEKVTAKTGLAKLLGAEGGAVPNNSEMGLLNTIFPPEFTQTVLDKRPLMQKLFSLGGEALNLPREIMATGDLSAPLRQGVFLIGRPRTWIPAVKDMFKYALSEDAYQGLQTDIQSRPTYALMRENNLALTNLDNPSLSGREEAFMSSLAEKIPGFGVIARASNRAYTGFLNKLRADTFDSLLQGAEDSGIDTATNPNVVSDIARFVNNATGRGDIGMLQKASVVLNGTLFSPRLMQSRLNLLNPAFYIGLDPYVRTEALKSLFGFAGTAATVAGLAKLGGADIGTDPRSADFMKIKVGDTRYDILGGFQQYIVAAYRLISGQMVSSTTGREFNLGEGYKPTTRLDIVARFLQSKENPVASFITSLLQGQTAVGEPFNLPTEVVDRFIPMVWQDMYDLARQDGNPLSAFKALPGVFGTGVQTYGNQIPMYAKTATGKPTIQWRQPPSLGEAIINKITGTSISNVPEALQKPLADQKLAELKKQAEIDKAKTVVLSSGQSQQVGDTLIYLDKGIVKTKKVPTNQINQLPTSPNISQGLSLVPTANAAETNSLTPISYKQFLNNVGLTDSPETQSIYNTLLPAMTGSSTGTEQYTVTNNKTGAVKTYDLSPIPRPTLTGSSGIDKQLMATYKSNLSQQQKDVIAVWEAGLISQDQAIAKYNQIAKLKSSGVGTKARKLTVKKLTFAKVKASKVPKISLRNKATTRLRSKYYNFPKRFA